MPTDEQIETEIQSKGLTAPRVTPARIEAVIRDEYSTTLDRAFPGAPSMPGMERFTIVALVLENGFIVTGESAPASAANFDPELGHKIARQKAVDKIWMLEGYALRTQLNDAEAK